MNLVKYHLLRVRPLKASHLSGSAKMSKLLAEVDMFYTYVLQCANSINGRRIFYIGSTSDLRKRLSAHLNKTVATTKRFDRIELVYYEACLNKTDAIKRERQLKTGFGRGYIKRRLEYYLKDLRG